jgi:hypothetical protein
MVGRLEGSGKSEQKKRGKKRAKKKACKHIKICILINIYKLIF